MDEFILPCCTPALAQGPGRRSVRSTRDLAAQGKGVCLGRTPMVSDFVRTGTLVAPLRHVLRSPRAYDLIEPRGRGSAGARTFVS